MLYSLMHSPDGVIQQSAAAARLNGFIRGLEVRENKETAILSNAGKVTAKD